MTRNPAPFDLDGARGRSRRLNRRSIAEVWQRVSEDFAPFDVNVTTIDPGVEALRQDQLRATSRYGQRMVISPTNFAGAGVLGVALLDVFDSSLDRPAFVFSGGASTKTIAEAVSHEAGHTLGLSHDADVRSPATTTAMASWAPIMGRSITRRSRSRSGPAGEYAGADNPQDDLALIAGVHRLPARRSWRDGVTERRWSASSSTTARRHRHAPATATCSSSMSVPEPSASRSPAARNGHVVEPARTGRPCATVPARWSSPAHRPHPSGWTSAVESDRSRPGGTRSRSTRRRGSTPIDGLLHRTDRWAPTSWSCPRSGSGVRRHRLSLDTHRDQPHSADRHAERHRRVPRVGAGARSSSR